MGKERAGGRALFNLFGAQVVGWLHFFFCQLIVQGCRGALTLGADHLVTVVLLGELEKAR